MSKQYKTLPLCLGVILAISLVNYLVLAWTEPSQTPPGGNVNAPINVGNTGQSKSGGLILNTGGAATGLIVDKGNVGIGTNSPSQKLEVSGSGLFTVDVCNGAGACLSQLNDFIGSTALVRNQHTYKACIDAGGQVVDSDVSFKQCRFGSEQKPVSSCPKSGNWRQYENFSTTLAATCHGQTLGCGGAGRATCEEALHLNYQDPARCTCVTGSHSWGNTAVEICPYACVYVGQPNGWCGICPDLTCYATIIQIGCY